MIGLHFEAHMMHDIFQNTISNLVFISSMQKFCKYLLKM